MKMSYYDKAITYGMNCLFFSTYFAFVVWGTTSSILNYDKILKCDFGHLLYSYLILLYYPIITGTIKNIPACTIEKNTVKHINEHRKNCQTYIYINYATYTTKNKYIITLLQYQQIGSNIDNILFSILDIAMVFCYVWIYIYTLVMQNQLRISNCKNINNFHLAINTTVVIIGICSIIPVVYLSCTYVNAFLFDVHQLHATVDELTIKDITTDGITTDDKTIEKCHDDEETEQKKNNLEIVIND